MVEGAKECVFQLKLSCVDETGGLLAVDAVDEEVGNNTCAVPKISSLFVPGPDPGCVGLLLLPELIWDAA